MSSANRMSGASLAGSYGGRVLSAPASVSSFDAEVNVAVFDDTLDSGDGMVGAESNFTTNEVIHINKWGSSLRVSLLLYSATRLTRNGRGHIFLAC
jgi:hypothetical protein